MVGPDGAAVHSLDDVIAFNNAHAAEELPLLRPGDHGDGREEGPADRRGVPAALARNRRLARTQGIDAVMTKYQLDALVAPTGGPAWLIDLVNGDGGTASAPRPVDGGRGRRLSAHHRADGIRSRAAGGHLVLRPGVERADADQARVRLRAGDEAPATAGVRATADR